MQLAIDVSFDLRREDVQNARGSLAVGESWTTISRPYTVVSRIVATEVSLGVVFSLLVCVESELPSVNVGEVEEIVAYDMSCRVSEATRRMVRGVVLRVEEM